MIYEYESGGKVYEIEAEGPEQLKATIDSLSGTMTATPKKSYAEGLKEALPEVGGAAVSAVKGMLEEPSFRAIRNVTAPLMKPAEDLAVGLLPEPETDITKQAEEVGRGISQAGTTSLLAGGLGNLSKLARASNIVGKAPIRSALTRGLVGGSARQFGVASALTELPNAMERTEGDVGQSALDSILSGVGNLLTMGTLKVGGSVGDIIGSHVAGKTGGRVGALTGNLLASLIPAQFVPDEEKASTIASNLAFAGISAMGGESLKFNTSKLPFKAEKLSRDIIYSWLGKRGRADVYHGKDPADAVLKYDLAKGAKTGEDVLANTSKAKQDVYGKIELELKAPDTKSKRVNLGEDGYNITKPIDDMISEVSRKSPNEKSALISKLEAIKEDIQGRFATMRSVSISKVNELRQDMWSEITNWLDPDSQVATSVKYKIGAVASKVIEENAPRVKDLNRDYGNIASAEKMLLSKVEGDRARRIFSASDKVAAVVGAVLNPEHAVRTGLTAGILNHVILRNPQVKIAVAKILNAASKSGRSLLVPSEREGIIEAVMPKAAAGEASVLDEVTSKQEADRLRNLDLSKFGVGSTETVVGYQFKPTEKITVEDVTGKKKTFKPDGRPITVLERTVDKKTGQEIYRIKDGNEAKVTLDELNKLAAHQTPETRPEAAYEILSYPEQKFPVATKEGRPITKYSYFPQDDKVYPSSQGENHAMAMPTDRKFDDAVRLIVDHKNKVFGTRTARDYYDYPDTPEGKEQFKADNFEWQHKAKEAFQAEHPDYKWLPDVGKYLDRMTEELDGSREFVRTNLYKEPVKTVESVKRGTRVVGAPNGVEVRLSAIKRLADKGRMGKDWYRDVGYLLADVFGTELYDKAAKIFSEVSTGARPTSNLIWTLKPLYQELLGEKVSTGRYPANTSGNVAKILKGGEPPWNNPEGLKKKAFYETIRMYAQKRLGLEIAKPTMSVIDLWMARAFGYKNDMISKTQYKYVDAKVKAIAESMGVDFWEAQAMIWLGKQMEMKRISPSAMEGLENLSGGLLSEYVSPSDAHLDFKGKMALTEYMNSKFTMPDGRNEILQSLGIIQGKAATGLGGWEGAVSPSMRSIIYGTTYNFNSNIDAKVVERAASAIGYVLRQDAVAFSKSADKGVAAGVFNIGRPMSVKEAGFFADSLNKRGLKGFAPDENGVRVIDYDGSLTTSKLGAILKEIAVEFDKEFGETRADVLLYKDAGKLYFGGEDGGSYLKALNKSGAAQNEVRRLRSKADEVREDFYAKFPEFRKKVANSNIKTE